MNRPRNSRGQFLPTREPLMPLVWEKADPSLNVIAKPRRCSGCGALRDRGADQRYCAACHAEAQRKYRVRQAALIEAGRAALKAA
jgi:hypothetical protein